MEVDKTITIQNLEVTKEFEKLVKYDNFSL